MQIDEKIFYRKGFTLVEITVILAILLILSAVAIPMYTGCLKKVHKTVCDANCLQLQKMYNIYLITENMAHQEWLFTEYRQSKQEVVCPEGADIFYVDGKVQCSVHSNEVVQDDDTNENEVPFL